MIITIRNSIAAINNFPYTIQILLHVTSKVYNWLFHLYPPVTRKRRWRYILDEFTPD